MHAQYAPGKSPRPRIAATAALALLVAAVIYVPLAYAKVAMNTIDPTAIVRPNGRRIKVTGPLSTDQAQPVLMRVTVTQRSTGAIAEGYTAFTGTIPIQEWMVRARAVTLVSFEPGPATVVALAQSRVIGAGGGPDDAHQWLVNVDLVED
jgi:hypothetical protein